MTEFKECESCPGYCCVQSPRLHTPLTEGDILRIAKHLRIPTEKFVNTFVTITGGRYRYEGAKDIIAHFKPQYKVCHFLRQGLCGINDVKPEACKTTVPIKAAPGLTCAEWHKVRLGWRF